MQPSTEPITFKKWIPSIVCFVIFTATFLLSRDLSLFQMYLIRIGSIASISTAIYTMPINAKVKSESIVSILAVFFFHDSIQLFMASRDDDKPFNYTIYIKQDTSINVNFQYPKYIGDSVYLEVGPKPEIGIVESHFDANFKQLDYRYRQKKVALNLVSKFWTPLEDSVLLMGDNNTVFVTPSGVLSKVIGQVTDEKTDKPILGAIVQCGGLQDTTDVNGNFKLYFPIANQKRKYDINAFKEGYQGDTRSATPETGEPLALMLKRNK